MFKLVIRKIDRFINCLTLAVLIFGGMFIHILTALTIKSYNGSPWGYVSFFLPGLAEIYLAAVQISENMYNYLIIICGFSFAVSTVGAVWFIKNSIKSRLDNAVTE